LGEIVEDLKAANMTMLFQKGQDGSKKIYIYYESPRSKSILLKLHAERITEKWVFNLKYSAQCRHWVK
jgi:hypothetical protein